MIKEFNGMKPKIGERSWIAETASIIGEVELGDDCSIWFGSVIRGDVHYIKLGDRTNIQDLSMIHVSEYTEEDRSDGFPVEIGNDVTVGHKVMIHGAKISDACLIGMNATLLDGCEIGKESIVGAGALVTQNKKFPPRSLILGSPAKLIRQLTQEEVDTIYYLTNLYIGYKNQYLK
ncbi:gamma carbonic anhydrase family protein [Candidatus Cloacimonadota bacterium]